ncbi:hypothetical protein AC3HA14_1310 [Escherichia phage vB_EcoM_3HA14]|uniref:Lysin n=1 Tax=Escherichia phage vB_EcoM_3HA14 TaxID=2653705 RepID=A0A7G3MA46_9CAUD|nr:hypothetical protein AC3HA14_1310 [Escherichia phage vB_EcoM_3HA14]
MKKFVLGLCLFFTAHLATASDCPELTISQKVNMLKAYNYGEGQMGKGWGIPLAAIALQESQLGVMLENKKTHDYGVFQNHLKTVVKRNKVSPKVAKKKLVSDFHYSAKEAHKELLFWTKVHGNPDGKYPMKRVLASYNAGYKYKIPKARQYSQDVYNNMKLLAQCEFATNIKKVKYERIKTI